MIDPKKFPKAARLQQQREEKYAAEQARLKALSAQPKRSAETQKKIKADIEAAEKSRAKLKTKKGTPSS
jgi:hypothetical protein